MILNYRHIPWALFVLLATTCAGGLYLANFHPALLPVSLTLPSVFGPVPPLRNTVGGTPLGIVFGTLALLIFFFASALGIRKKRRLWRIGNVQTWLRAHIWLTILTIPLVCFHSGFQLGGPMTATVMGIYAIVMVSGFFGLAMQQFMPRVMTKSLPREVVYEQIPHIRLMLVEAAQKLRKELDPGEKKAATGGKPAAAAAAAASEETAVPKATGTAVAEEPDPSDQLLRDFLEEECLPYLRKRRGERHRLGDPKVSEDLFRILKLNVSEKHHPLVSEIQTWCDDRRMMDLQSKLHHWLHGWLLFHVPFSFALLVLTLWHAWVALTYIQG